MHINASFRGGAGYEETCMSYPAKLPEIFGPGVWWTLHTTASTYPTNPDESKRKGCVAFVSSVPSMLPCQACRQHLEEQLQSYDIPTACSDGEHLSRMWCEIHNAVNKRTNKPLLDCSIVREEYLTVPVCSSQED